MSKSKGELGFRSLFGLNIALMGKHCWNFMNNHDALVSGVFKSRYFLDTHCLKAVKWKGSSFIWSGMWMAKEELKKGFRWKVGDGKDIVAVKDAWLRAKSDFCVEEIHVYEGRMNWSKICFSLT